MVSRYKAILLTIFMVTLCGGAIASAQMEADDTWLAPFPQLGLEIAFPRGYYESLTISHGYGMEEAGGMRSLIVMFNGENFPALQELSRKYATLNEEQIKEISEIWEQTTKTLLEIKRFGEWELDASVTENPAEEITGVKGAVEIGRQQGYVYIACEPEVDVSGMSEKDQAMFVECRALVPAMWESAKLIPIAAPPSIEEVLPAFAGVDLFGNPVTNDIFKGKKVTMINIWATFCGPCIEEMPDLGDLARDLPEGGQLIGIVIDIESDHDLRFAREIMEKAGADFINIVPDDALLSYCGRLVGVPTTIFVDENGALLGSPIIGAASAEKYRAALEGYLQ